ncbi:hypothetical protein G7B40_037500 [Aetokthonos hydrillicola Thurmond2011]|uniref:Uncharacterized protein n=1 Tax=Aetokthonos hydrillicola Thurmond2011 TaxID=2712845 RepID=A0AAP5IEI3_9CYAN|nr:hypothetical protein [Aetokthonos hydrillicola]MBO3461235.1 hypothetical protein [Aetokthonos hydrillicola CCALA 1050]MBW4591036.1 hypothetical protein [Aetokthonos hydrillicola CCALA 1050]MDR9900206.1 hypothetical protein [Aetokthonos hydrillicola Thurmond2011]
MLQGEELSRLPSSFKRSLLEVVLSGYLTECDRTEQVIIGGYAVILAHRVVQLSWLWAFTLVPSG